MARTRDNPAAAMNKQILSFAITLIIFAWMFLAAFGNEYAIAAAIFTMAGLGLLLGFFILWAFVWAFVCGIIEDNNT